jgi:5,10-methylene-tetrahydrofolate dehydrogenase/methenyl tetrahydrofolate cyclohydrolase
MARECVGSSHVACFRLQQWSDELHETKGVRPGLAVVLVGCRTDSATYVRMKKKAAAEVQTSTVTVHRNANVQVLLPVAFGLTV